MTSSDGNMEDDKKVDILLQRDQTIAEVLTHFPVTFHCNSWEILVLYVCVRVQNLYFGTLWFEIVFSDNQLYVVPIHISLTSIPGLTSHMHENFKLDLDDTVGSL